MVVNLAAAGDLDAVVDVYVRRRSQTRAITCDATNERGKAALAFQASKGDIYLFRVAQVPNSVSGDFTLDVFAPVPPARPPGRRLGRGGVTSTVDPVLNPSDAYSSVLRAGHTYRVNLYSGDCVGLEMFEPGTTDFDTFSVRSEACGGYFLYTPKADAGGRYSFRISANSGRGSKRYHLQVDEAGRDDTAPGTFIRNYARVGGILSGRRIDVVDLYRFDVTSRSDLDLRVLRAPSDAFFELVLLDDRGRRLSATVTQEGEAELRRRVRRGRYFVAVRASAGATGRYTLRRISRTITAAHVRVNGRHRSTMAPGRRARIRVNVSPGARGPVVITVERFDPLFGWQFERRVRAREERGHATVVFRPRSVGRYRVSASYLGTRFFSPSDTRTYATLLVAGRLRQ